MDKEKQLEILRERNKFMEKLGAFSLSLSVIFNTVAVRDWSFIVFIIFLAIIILGGLHLLNKIDKNPQIVPVYMSISVTIFTFFIIQQDQHILTFLTIFFNLIGLSFYQSQKPILMTGTMQFVLTIAVYILFGDKVFPGWGILDIVSISMYIVLFTGLLMYQTSFFNRLQLQNHLSQVKEKQQQEKLQKILRNIKENIVNDFSYKLNENIKETSLISNEITATFTDVAGKVEEQFTKVEEISHLLLSTDESVKRTAHVAGNMNDLMNKSIETIEDGELKSKEINNEINILEKTINQVTATIEHLLEKSGKIEGIIQAIDDMSQKTKFLALNTTIEAQRVEGNNKAFNVISDEIMKLATESELAAKSIAEILLELKESTENAGIKIEQGKVAVKTSKDNTEKMLSAFNQITSNSKLVMKEIQTNNKLMKTVEGNTDTTRTQSERVSQIASRTQLHIQDVLQRSEEQRQKVYEIEKSYEELEKSLINLYESAQKESKN